jgi:hypothetical protein
MLCGVVVVEASSQVVEDVQEDAFFFWFYHPRFGTEYYLYQRDDENIRNQQPEYCRY